jgi:hypothetical protein
MDELDALEDDVLESALHELIVAPNYLCGSTARAALNVAHASFRKFFPKVSGWLDPAVRQAALQLGAGRLRIKVPA